MNTARGGLGDQQSGSGDCKYKQPTSLPLNPFHRDASRFVSDAYKYHKDYIKRMKQQQVELVSQLQLNTNSSTSNSNWNGNQLQQNEEKDDIDLEFDDDTRLLPLPKECSIWLQQVQWGDSSQSQTKTQYQLPQLATTPMNDSESWIKDRWFPILSTKMHWVLALQILFGVTQVLEPMIIYWVVGLLECAGTGGGSGNWNGSGWEFMLFPVLDERCQLEDLAYKVSQSSGDQDTVIGTVTMDVEKARSYIDNQSSMGGFVFDNPLSFSTKNNSKVYVLNSELLYVLILFLNWLVGSACLTYWEYIAIGCDTQITAYLSRLIFQRAMYFNVSNRNLQKQQNQKSSTWTSSTDIDIKDINLKEAVQSQSKEEQKLNIAEVVQMCQQNGVPMDSIWTPCKNYWGLACLKVLFPFYWFFLFRLFGVVPAIICCWFVLGIYPVTQRFAKLIQKYTDVHHLISLESKKCSLECFTTGIRLVKYFAWERFYLEKFLKLSLVELGVHRQGALINFLQWKVLMFFALFGFTFTVVWFRIQVEILSESSAEWDTYFTPSRMFCGLGLTMNLNKLVLEAWRTFTRQLEHKKRSVRVENFLRSGSWSDVEMLVGLMESEKASGGIGNGGGNGGGENGKIQSSSAAVEVAQVEMLDGNANKNENGDTSKVGEVMVSSVSSESVEESDDDGQQIGIYWDLWSKSKVEQYISQQRQKQTDTNNMENAVTVTSKVGETEIAKVDENPPQVDQDSKQRYYGLVDLEGFSWRKGELHLVKGRVGSGKSWFLRALMGEMHLSGGEWWNNLVWNSIQFQSKTNTKAQQSTSTNWNWNTNSSGRSRKRQRIAYVSQEAWIQSGTLRNNILFFRDFDQGKYERALDAACLGPDIESFEPDGDNIEIGERGVTLSGGQKMRVALWRSLYDFRESDMLIFDDVFWWLDAHTSLKVWQNLIDMRNGIIKDGKIPPLMIFATNLNPFEKLVINCGKQYEGWVNSVMEITPYNCNDCEAEDNKNNSWSQYTLYTLRKQELQEQKDAEGEQQWLVQAQPQAQVQLQSKEEQEHLRGKARRQSQRLSIVWESRTLQLQLLKDLEQRQKGNNSEATDMSNNLGAPESKVMLNQQLSTVAEDSVVQKSSTNVSDKIELNTETNAGQQILQSRKSQRRQSLAQQSLIWQQIKDLSSWASKDASKTEDPDSKTKEQQSLLQLQNDIKSQECQNQILFTQEKMNQFRSPLFIAWFPLLRFWNTSLFYTVGSLVSFGLIGQFFVIVTDLVLEAWSMSVGLDQKDESTLSTFLNWIFPTTISGQSQSTFYLVLFIVATVIWSYFQIRLSFIYANTGRRSWINLNWQLKWVLIRAPWFWYDKTPVGRII